MDKKIGIIIQARIASTRLPNKIMLDLGGKSILSHVIERCQIAQANEVIVATSTNKENDVIEEFCKKHGYSYFRGSEEDVLSRYYECAKRFNLDIILRVTSDCPLIAPEVLNEAIEKFKRENVDYLGNATKRSYPRGLDIEIFRFEALEKAYNLTTEKSDREHVTAFIYHNPEIFKISHLIAEGILKNPHLRLTIDTHEDLKLLRIIYNNLYEKEIKIMEVIKFLNKNPELARINLESEKEHLKKSNQELKQEFLQESEVKIKNVDESDKEFLFYLRNQPEVYKYFWNPREVLYNEHINWITPIISKERKGVFLYIIYCNQKRAGQIRFDIEDEGGKVSISLLKEYQGKGIATKSLSLGIQKIKEKNIKKLLAKVDKRNSTSIKFFKSLKFEEKKNDGTYKIFERIIQ